MIPADLFSILSLSAFVFAFIMMISWLIAVKIDFLSLVDAVWSLGIGIGAATIAMKFGKNNLRSVFAASLGLFWGLRLGIHLMVRLKKHFPIEDRRYQKLKVSWQKNFMKKTFLFFIFQAVTQSLFVSPFIILALDAESFPRPIEIIGIAISFFAILGEFVSDSQLKKFKADPLNQGKVCNIGLWRFSRHPNYFFEWVIWCGLSIMTLQAPHGAFSLFCPVVMLFLLLFITGVPPSEEQSIESRGKLYLDYQRTTNTFFPWFPKHKH